MLLKRIEATNFKTFEGYHEFDLEEGINLILGKNGKGKSSIIDDVRLLTLGLSSAKNLGELICWSTSKNDNKFSIACEFEEKGVNYRSEMETEIIGRSTKTNRKLLKEGDVIVEGAEPVTEYLKDIFDPVLTDNALFLRQSTNQIVNITDAERRDVLKKMKDIDYTLKVKKEIEPEITRIKEEIIEVDKDIYSLENKSYDPKIVKEVPFSEVKYNELLSNFEKLNEELILINGKLEEKVSKENKIIDLKEELKSNEADIIRHSKSQADKSGKILENNKFKISEKGEIEAKIKEQETTVDILFTGFDKEDLESQFTSDKEDCENKLKTLEESLKEYPVKRISKYDATELDETLLKKNTCEVKISTLKKSIKDMEEGVCPTCGKPYEASEIEVIENELFDVEKELTSVENNISILRKEKKEHEEKVETNQKNKEKKTSIENEISGVKTMLESLNTQFEKDVETGVKQNEKDLKSAEETLSLYKEKLENIDAVYEVKDKKLESEILNLKELNKTLERRNKELTSFIKDLSTELESFEVGNIETKREELSSIKSKISEYESIVTENKTIRRFNEDLEKEEKSDKKSLKKFKKDKDKLKGSLLDLESSKQILLKDLPNFIISKSLDELVEDMNVMIDQIYDRSLNIKMKQNKSSITMQYGANPDKLKNCRGSLSGCEAQLCAISFVSAFNQRLGLNCIIMDEVDAAMTDENANSLYEAIGEMTNSFKQIILITHKETMKSYLENHYSANVISL